MPDAPDRIGGLERMAATLLARLTSFLFGRRQQPEPLPLTDWPFQDPPNIYVFTSKAILDEGKWIKYVLHNEDGDWQFHSDEGAPASEEDARLVSLDFIVMREPRIAELANLPNGWCAWRDRENDKWKNQRDI